MKLFNRESRAEKLAKKGSFFFKRAEPQDDAPVDEETVVDIEAVEEVEVVPEEIIIPPRTVTELAETVLQLSMKKGAYPPASDGEKEFARNLRDQAAEIKDVKVRLEPYYIRPLLGRRSLILLAGVLLLSLIFYFGYTPVALAILLLAAPLSLLLSLGRKEAAFLLPKRIAYNLVAVSEAEQTDKTVIITSSYDNAYGSPYRSARLAKLEKPFLVAAVASLPALILFSIVKIAVGFETVPELVTLSLLPLLIMLPSIFYLATYTSWDKRHIVENNQKATGAALAAFEYFAARPEERPENTRIIFAAFSGRQNGNSGAFAFLKQHWGRDDLLVNPAVIDIETIEGGKFVLPGYDNSGFQPSGTDATAKLKAALEEEKIEYTALGKELAAGAEHAFAAFSKNRIEAATLILKGDTDAPSNEIETVEIETVEAAINTLIAAVKQYK
ncbi:MAG: hypothetical protein LBT55_01655 [Clostridiaceae bacterium]|jgi:hypothetical protein|nr:hypothetical protein [Clostridiaceae bacterium]